MKFSFLVHSSQIQSQKHNQLGCSNMMVLDQLAKSMKDLGIQGQIFNLPIHARAVEQASPFSIQSAFALNPLDLDLFAIAEVKSQAELVQDLTQLQEQYYSQYADCPALAYPLRGTMVEWTLERAFAQFAPKGKRKTSYDQFLAQAAYWLSDYCNHEANPVQKAPPVEKAIKGKKPPKLKKAAKLKKLTKLELENKIAYLKYKQFLCWEQGLRLHQGLQDKSIGLVLNLPFGLDLTSADVQAHPQVFDDSLQVGCSPEPYNGFPEQAWGIAPYREKSKALKEYLKQRLNWLSHFGDGLFLDHLVGWCGQYVLPVKLPIGPGPHGEFLTEDPDQRAANLKWVLKILQQSKMEIMGELAGDLERMSVSKKVLGQLQKKGGEVTAMAIPRWEKNPQGELLALKDYPSHSLLMVETHDTSTLLQYLTNRKGRHPDFEELNNILHFCRQVLALPVFWNQIPLRIDSLSEEAVWEIFRRLYQGSPAQELVFTLPGLLTWLHPLYRTIEVTTNINIQPGTSGLVGNPTGNWSFFSPPLEAMADLKAGFKEMGPRKFIPFEPVQALPSQHNGVEACWSSLENKKPLGIKGGELIALEKGDASHELLLYNPTPYHLQGVLHLPDLAWADKGVKITDQLLENETWEHDGREIAQKGLYYELAPGQRNHLFLTFSSRPSSSVPT